MKKVITILICSMVGVIGFASGVIFQKVKDERAIEYSGTMRVYDPGNGEKPVLFTDPDVDVRKILRNKKAVFHITKLKVEREDAG